MRPSRKPGAYPTRSHRQARGSWDAQHRASTAAGRRRLRGLRHETPRAPVLGVQPTERRTRRPRSGSNRIRECCRFSKAPPRWRMSTILIPVAACRSATAAIASTAPSVSSRSSPKCSTAAAGSVGSAVIEPNWAYGISATVSMSDGRYVTERFDQPSAVIRWAQVGQPDRNGEHVRHKRWKTWQWRKIQHGDAAAEFIRCQCGEFLIGSSTSRTCSPE